MKKNLFYLSFVMMCITVFFSSCKDEDEKPELPPVVEDVLAQYTGDKVKVKLDGVNLVAENLQIDLLQAADKSLTIKLINVIPGVKEFLIPNAEFEAATRSVYVSKLKGEASSAKAGYGAAFDGIVDEGVLTANITTDEIVGDSVDVNELLLIDNTFKGVMNIGVSDTSDPFEMEQNVYTLAATNEDPSSIKLEIKDFSFQGLLLGDISLDDVVVLHRGQEGADAVYGFKTEDQVMTLDGVGEVSIDARGTIIGRVMELTLKVNASDAKLTVDVDFKGDQTKVFDMQTWVEGDGNKPTFR